MPRHVKDRVRDLEIAATPTASLIHAFADAAAQYLANVTGGKVEIAMHGLFIVSRTPDAAAAQKRKG